MTKNLGNLFIDFEDDVIEDETGNHTLASRTGVSSSTDSVFGSASINATLTDGFIMNNGGTDFNLSNQPFTVDFWVKPIISYDTWSGIVQLRPSSSPIYDFSVAIHNGDKLIQFWSRDSGTYVCLIKTPVNSIIWDEWNHVAIVRYGNGTNEIKIFINGVEQTLTIDMPLTNNASFPNFTTTMRFCNTPNVGSLIGRLDNFRWVKGEALWTENFNVSSESALFYTDSSILITSIYNLGHRCNLRGKAKAGFVRPTIKQFFTSTNWEAVQNKTMAKVPASETANGYHTISADGYTVTKPVATSTFTYSFLDKPITNGKYYFEFTIFGTLGDVVIIDSFEATRETSGSIAGAYRDDSWGAYSHGGQMYEKDLHIGALSGAGYSGETIGVSIDMDNKVMKYRKSTVLGTIGSNTYPLPNNAYVAFDLAGSGYITINFGQSPFTYDVPTGFTSGLYI